MSVGVRVGIRAGASVGVAAGVGADPLGADSDYHINIFGQSNAEGYASAATLSDPSYADPFAAVQIIRQAAVAADPIVWRYFPGSNNTTPPSSYQDVAPHFFPGIFSDCMGVELSLAREVALFDGTWTLSTMGLAGSDLDDNWLASWPTAPPYLLAQHRTFLQTALAGKRLRAHVWIQGEHDATIEANALVYAANLEELFDDLDSNFGVVPTIIIQLHSGASPTYVSTVRAQQTLFRNTMRPWTALIDCSDLTLVDGLHYSADSYITMGERIATALSAMLTTTSITVSISESPDPLVADGGAFTYSLVATNTGGATAANATVTLELPAGVGYTSGSGTGWTVTESAGVVTCSRASMSAGAAPAITINCTAPTGVGSGSITADATVTADNVQTMATDSETTTLTAPAITIDGTSGIYIPQNATEWGNFITAEGLTGLVGVPDLLLLFQEASGNLVDAIGGLTFTAGGTNQTYQQTVTGWTTKSVRVINAATANFVSTDASLPSVNTTSIAGLLYGRLSSAPSASRNVVGAGTASPTGIQISTTPRLVAFDGANTATSTNSPASSVRPYGWQHNVTGTSTFFCTDEEKLLPTFSASATGKRVIVGAFSGVNCPPFDYLYMPVWFGAKAEMAASTWAALLDALGFTRTWTP